jgi:hypothetical protein
VQSKEKYFPKAAQLENKCGPSFVADSAAAAGFRSRKKREMNNKIRLPETTAAQLQADVAHENAKIESSRGGPQRDRMVTFLQPPVCQQMADIMQSKLQFHLIGFLELINICVDINFNFILE